MACKTCDHTMHGLGRVEDGRRYWWCPRCGSLKDDAPPYGDNTCVPNAWPRALEVLRKIQYWPVDSRQALVMNEVTYILRDCDPKRRETP